MRHVVAKNHPGNGEWQETLLYNQPGMRPEDTVDLKALTLANQNGETHTYSWEDGSPVKLKDPKGPRQFLNPENANIQIVNFRSKWRPFIVYETDVKIIPVWIGASTYYSKFPCWNHWPVAQLPNDGRKALVSDKPSHFSLCTSRGVIRPTPDGSESVYLYGMTNQPIESLVPLAKSWNAAPTVALSGSGFESQGDDKSQRAYVFNRTDAKADSLEFTLEASH